MVMFLFVIAYLGGAARTRPGRAGRLADRSAAIAAAGALLVEIVVVDRLEGRRAALERGARSAARSASPGEIGALFLTDHLLAFEITSIVLLVAAVGGVILGSPRAAHAGRRTPMLGPDVAGT